MASARSDRTHHQDYIARIRYSNTLPPPPNHPKLLNIPNTGLSSGQYTSAAYASRLAREQPLNIEADAELGMPIDLVGLPGVFDGDESCLYGLDQAPLHHPADRALLKPLSALGKGTSSTASVSFLRRTEYISTDQNRRNDPKTPGTPANARKRKRPETENENDPARILHDVVAGFDIANPSNASSQDQDIQMETRRAWDRPQHPTNPALMLVDSYPLLPDLDAVSDSFWNIVVKFSTNPGSTTTTYDQRLDAAILRPLPLPPNVEEQHKLAQAAWAENPIRAAPPKPNYHYEFFLPSDADEAARARQRLNTAPIRNDQPATNGSTNGDHSDPVTFRYPRIRHYQTFQQSGDVDNPFSDSIALALYDPADSITSTSSSSPTVSTKPKKQKAAYFYPVGQRTFVRARHLAPSGKAGGVNEEDKADVLEIETRDPTAEDDMRRNEMRDVRYFGMAVGAEA